MCEFALLELMHPIEAGISSNANIHAIDICQQLFTFLVLNENMGEELQESPVPDSIPPEKKLAVSKFARGQINRDLLCF